MAVEPGRRSRVPAQDGIEWSRMERHLAYKQARPAPCN